MRRRCSGSGGLRCASRSNGRRRRGSARCAARRLLVQQRRQIQRHFPRGEKIFKERGEAGDAARARRLDKGEELI